MDQKIEHFKLPFYKRLSSTLVDLMFTFSLFIILLLAFSVILPSFMNNDKELNDYSNNRSKIIYQSNLYELEGTKMVEVYEDDNITLGFEYTGHLDEYLKNKNESGLFIIENGQYEEIGTDEDLEKFYKDNWNIARKYIDEREDYKYYDQLYQGEYQKYIEMLFGIPAVISVVLLLILVPFINKEGKTLGKLIFKISIVNDNLNPLNRLQIFMRQFFFVLFTMTIIPTLVSFILSLFNKEGKTLHDYISLSRVIDSKVKNILLDRRKKEIQNQESTELVFKEK